MMMHDSVDGAIDATGAQSYLSCEFEMEASCGNVNSNAQLRESEK